MKPALLLSSRNAKKAKEIKDLLGDLFEITDLTTNTSLPEVEEDSNTFSGNATLKAVEISKLVDGYVIADDSGLEVEALSGAPGVISARYSGKNATDETNNEKLIQELTKINEAKPWHANFTCYIVLAKAGQKIAEFDGKVYGHIQANGLGDGGFGYDPLFIPNGYEHSFGQLPAEVKGEISHRANALKQLVEWCKINPI